MLHFRSSPRCTPSLADVDHLVAARRQVLPDVVRTDRQLAMAAIDHHGELDRARPAVVVQRVQRGTDRAAGEQDVVDEHDRRPVEREVDVGDRLGQDRPDPDVVAVEGDVERAARHLDALDAVDRLDEALGKRHAAGLQPDHGDAVEAVVALDHLVGDAHRGSGDVVGVHDPLVRNKNAPERGRDPAFPFSHSQLLPFGPHRTRFTVRMRRYQHRFSWRGGFPATPIRQEIQPQIRRRGAVRRASTARRSRSDRSRRSRTARRAPPPR